MDYNFQYSIVLELVNEKADVNFTDDILQEHVKEAVEFYNNQSRSAKNPKEILECRESREKLSISLGSREPLQVPTKALGGFSKKLLSLHPELGEYVIGKRLFKGTACEKQTTESIDYVSDISDVDALKLLLELFVNKSAIDVSEMRLRKRTIEDIKKNLINYINDLKRSI